MPIPSKLFSKKRLLMAERTSQTNHRELRFAKLLRELTCPHCWFRFSTGDVVWVAKHDDLRGDPILGEDAHVRFLPTRFTVQGEALDARGTPCQILACPRCHLVIPRVFLKYEPLIFSLIGVPFSGKSYFLTAMTWELSRILPTKFFIVFNDVDASSNFTLTEYQKALFFQEGPDALAGIVKTDPTSQKHYDFATINGQTVPLPRPFLYSMRPLRAHPKASDIDALSRVLCLYDNAGEHFLPGQQDVVTEHMAQSKVLMFLFDPTQDPRVRAVCQTVSEDVQLNRFTHSQLQSTILTEAVTRVRRFAHMPANAKLDQPLMVLVSKSDIWGKLIGKDIDTEPIVEPAPPASPLAVVDLGRIRRVSSKVRQFMLENIPEFVAAAEDACREVIYIPVSALGCSPQFAPDGKMLVIHPRDVKPRWVTVPILYAFSVWASGLVASVTK
jgi:hypothetical protein